MGKDSEKKGSSAFRTGVSAAVGAVAGAAAGAAVPEAAAANMAGKMKKVIVNAKDVISAIAEDGKEVLSKVAEQYDEKQTEAIVAEEVNINEDAEVAVTVEDESSKIEDIKEDLIASYNAKIAEAELDADDIVEVEDIKKNDDVEAIVITDEKETPTIESLKAELLEDYNEQITAEPIESEDAEIRMASNVNDDMKFGQAFAAARIEVGAGGAFKWNGKVYHTYTKEEWNDLSEDERAEFSAHFSDEDVNDPVDVEIAELEEHNIEYNGVAIDPESNNSRGIVTIDGIEVQLINSDGDNDFDAIQADLNGDGVIGENETASLDNDSIMVDKFQSLYNADDSMLAGDGVEDANDDINMEA